MYRAEKGAVRKLCQEELIATVASGSKVFYLWKLDQLLLNGDMGPVPLSKGLAVALMSDHRALPDPASLFQGERDA